jgi:hypothetical protein
MSNAVFTAGDVDELLTEENILDGAFECLRRIWADPEALDARELSNSEYRSRRLEQELIKLYPSLYDDLIEQMGGHPVTTTDSGSVVIMDALSLREGFQLEQDLRDDHGWDVSLSWAPVERLPSETEFITRAWFDSHAPSAVSRSDFSFIGDMDVPQLPGTTPEYVWTRYPDKRLEAAMKGNYSTEEVADIYTDVKTLLEDIINESLHSEFLVTSDHGYVNHLGNNPYSLRDDLEDSLSSKFSGRHRDVANGYAYQQLEEADVIERVGDHYVVRGHYSWTKRGATKRIMHGGLSLLECMTPTLSIKTEAK